MKVFGGNMLHDLEPCVLKSLHELVSLVHDHVSAADLSNAVDSSSTSDIEKTTEPKKIEISELYYLEEDPVANILWALEPLNLQKMFLAMLVSPHCQHFSEFIIFGRIAHFLKFW